MPRIKKAKVYPRDRMVTAKDEQELLPACPRPLKDVLTIMLDGGMRNGEVVGMRWEYINWDGAFYFNPKGKSRKARRPVPLSERVIALLKGLRQEGQDDGWVFPSDKSRPGHIELSGEEHMSRGNSAFRIRSSCTALATRSGRWRWQRQEIPHW
ncbi:MAG TPA: tyrosine-type recombinase/integrase [Candidatus Angelobacter sp.]|nr:tyrosine-type recombinase/integrase [Candidatus Angelobacter sp.]